jgi:hypothetical protein
MRARGLPAGWLSGSLSAEPSRERRGEDRGKSPAAVTNPTAPAPERSNA